MVLCMANAANIIRADAAACALRPQATLYYSWKQLHGLGRDRPVINMHRLVEKPGFMFHGCESMSLPPVIGARMRCKKHGHEHRRATPWAACIT